MHNNAAVKDVLQLIPYGLYVACSLDDGVPVSMIANWVTQVSFHPPCVALAVEQDSKMRSCIESSSVFCINILSAGGTDTAKAFLKSPEALGETIGGRPFTRALNGTSFLIDAIGSFECRVVRAIPLADHVLFIGEVVDALQRPEGGDALTLRETGWRYSK